MKGSCGFMGRRSLVVNQHPGKFGYHRHCGSGDDNIPANIVISLQMWDPTFIV